MKYEITILNQKNEWIANYQTTIVPVIGDTLIISETHAFEVEMRILSTSKDNKNVVLIGRHYEGKI